MKNLLLTSALLLTLAGLGACNRPQSAEEAQKDISAAQTEGAKDVADAEADALKDLAEARRDAAKSEIDSGNLDAAARNERLAESREKSLTEVASAEYKVVETEIQAAYQVAKERCSTYAGKEKGDCLDRAKNEYDQRLTVAKNKRENAADAPKL